MKNLIAEKDSVKINKKQIFNIIQIGSKDDLPSRAFDYFIVLTILVNIATLFLETFDQLNSWQSMFECLEKVTLVIFCIEYVLRLWTAEYLYPGRGRIKAILKFIVSYDGIVDLCTILPFIVFSGFIAFRMLRVVRILHLFRINTNYDSFNAITSVLIKKKNQIISSLFILLILMMFSSLGMYSVEHDAQPEVFTNAFSGIWWSISTILTVGYGDIYPVTFIGKLMAILISLLGVGVVAIPTGIISAGFVEQYTELQAQTNPGCKKQHELATISINKESDMLDKTAAEIEEQNDISISLIIRNSEVLLPMPATVIKNGDIIVCQSLEGKEYNVASSTQEHFPKIKR